MKRNRLIFRKVCNFNLLKTHSTYFPRILYLTGNFMKQLSAKFLLKKLSKIAKFENSHNRLDNFFFFLFFSIRVFFHGHWRLTGQQGKGGDHLLFHSTTSTRSRTFRHLFATLHVRWLSHIFNRIACIYQAATRWDLPPYRITIWLIDDVALGFCLFTLSFDSSFFVTAIWDG